MSETKPKNPRDWRTRLALPESRVLARILDEHVQEPQRSELRARARAESLTEQDVLRAISLGFLERLRILEERRAAGLARPQRAPAACDPREVYVSMLCASAKERGKQRRAGVRGSHPWILFELMDFPRALVGCPPWPRDEPDYAQEAAYQRALDKASDQVRAWVQRLDDAIGML